MNMRINTDSLNENCAYNYEEKINKLNMNFIYYLLPNCLTAISSFFYKNKIWGWQGGGILG